MTKIQKATKSAHNLVIDVQKPRGSFNLPFVDGLTQNYRDITNIVVKLEPSIHRSKDALLGECPKGQIISECIFDFLNFPKNHRKI